MYFSCQKMIGVKVLNGQNRSFMLSYSDESTVQDLLKNVRGCRRELKQNFVLVFNGRVLQDACKDCKLKKLGFDAEKMNIVNVVVLVEDRDEFVDKYKEQFSSHKVNPYMMLTNSSSFGEYSASALATSQLSTVADYSNESEQEEEYGEEGEEEDEEDEEEEERSASSFITRYSRHQRLGNILQVHFNSRPYTIDDFQTQWMYNMLLGRTILPSYREQTASEDRAGYRAEAVSSASHDHYSIDQDDIAPRDGFTHQQTFMSVVDIDSDE